MRAVHIVGAEAEVPEVHLRVVGAAQLDLQSGRGVGDEREEVGAAFDDHAELARQAVHLIVQVGDRQGDVVDSGCDHCILHLHDS